MPLAPGLLDLYVRQSFVETGSHRGDGIQTALDAGFEAVYSADISPFAYGWCCHRFQHRRTQVHLFLEDGRDLVRRVLGHFTSPAVFWLDAHWCGGNGEMEGVDGGKPDDHPLLGELATIAMLRPGSSHLLLIDDVRMMGTEEGWPALGEVERAIGKINVGYTIRYEDSLEFEQDILVAEVTR